MENITLKAVENKIIVKPIIDEQVVGEVVLETREEKPCHGIVVAVGQGRFLENGTREKMDVRVGDEVFFTRYAPDLFEVDGEEYYSLKQSSILGIIG